MSVSLLMFNLNEHEGILRNVEEMRDVVDEIVVVDSSPPDQNERLLTLVRDQDVKVYRVLPIGSVDSVRAFGASKVHSTYIINLDADEEATDPLKSDLRSLTQCAAYVVPRYEVGLRSYTYHLRLFGRTSVRYRGRSFDFPDVTGQIGWLDKAHGIIHHANYENYLEDKSRRERYLTIENVERPFTRRYLEERLTVRMHGKSVSPPFANRLRKSPDALLSAPLVRGTIELDYLHDLLLGKGLRAASFNRRYVLAKMAFLSGITALERSRLQDIARDVQSSGGLLQYLGLTDPAYLEKLTASFDWNLRGIEVYRRLLSFRHTFGRPAESVPATPGW